MPQCLIFIVSTGLFFTTLYTNTERDRDKAQIYAVAPEHNTCRSLWKYYSNTQGARKVGQITISSQLLRASKPL